MTFDNGGIIDLNKPRRQVRAKHEKIFFLAIGLVVLGSILALSSIKAYALDENDCLSCHGNPDLTKTNAEGKKISLYVNEELVNTAAHRFIDCTTCHTSEPHEVDTPLTMMGLVTRYA